MTTDILTLIPARIKATRLPRKPLAEIAGKPMICHVWEKAVKADLGPVFVATDSPEIRITDLYEPLCSPSYHISSESEAFNIFQDRFRSHEQISGLAEAERG